MKDSNKISIGENVVEYDDSGNIVQVSSGKNALRFNEDGSIVAKAGESRFLTRPDDGIPGKLAVICENGHSLRVDLPATIQTLTAKAVNITNPCPVCGGKCLRLAAVILLETRKAFSSFSAICRLGALTYTINAAC